MAILFAGKLLSLLLHDDLGECWHLRWSFRIWRLAEDGSTREAGPNTTRAEETYPPAWYLVVKTSETSLPVLGLPTCLLA